MAKVNRLKRRIWYRALSNPRIILEAFNSAIRMAKYKRTVKKHLKESSSITFEKHPIIYFRTPKCGSSSIYSLLKHSGKLIDYKTIDPEKRRALINSEEVRYKIIMLSPDEINDFRKEFEDAWQKSFKWAVVRNPYTRVISAWRFLEDLRDLDLLDILKNPPGPDKEGKYNRNYQHFTISLTELLSTADGLFIDKYLKSESRDSNFRYLSMKRPSAVDNNSVSEMVKC
jgi:hypothetical protein